MWAFFGRMGLDPFQEQLAGRVMIFTCEQFLDLVKRQIGAGLSSGRLGARDGDACLNPSPVLQFPGLRRGRYSSAEKEHKKWGKAQPTKRHERDCNARPKAGKQKAPCH